MGCIQDLAARRASLEATNMIGMIPIAWAEAQGKWEVVQDLAARPVNF